LPVPANQQAHDRPFFANLDGGSAILEEYRTGAGERAKRRKARKYNFSSSHVPMNKTGFLDSRAVFGNRTLSRMS
jgi:hypothetical protein